MQADCVLLSHWLRLSFCMLINYDICSVLVSNQQNGRPNIYIPRKGRQNRKKEWRAKEGNEGKEGNGDKEWCGQTKEQRKQRKREKHIDETRERPDGKTPAPRCDMQAVCIFDSIRLSVFIENKQHSQYAFDWWRTKRAEESQYVAEGRGAAISNGRRLQCL